MENYVSMLIESEASLAAFTISSLCAVLVACASAEEPNSPPAQAPPYLGLATPTDGFQVRSVGAEIAPGEEREYCEVARMPGKPGDEYYVSSIELGNGARSHHLGIAIAAPGSEAIAQLEALGVGNRVECPGPRLAFGEGIEVISTIQVP